MNASVPATILDQIARIVGPRGLTTDAETIAPHLVELRGLYRGRSSLLVRPASVDEVAGVVRLCAQHGIPLVPQGGNTSLCGGSVPFEEGREIILCLSRLNRIRDVDPRDYTMTVEAGCILQNVQQAAADADRLFPLSLGAEGSCQIGGNLSTNAGGINTLRYGNARDLVLGLEVVLPDGQVWDGLRRLRKDNTGYDLKHLFLGAEGTLGIITAAVLKLFPRPREEVTAIVAVASAAAAAELLSRLRAATGDSVTAFEYMARFGVGLAIKHVPGVRDPFDRPHEHYALLRASAGRKDSGLREIIEETLAAALEDGTAFDAVFGETEQQVRDLLAHPRGYRRGADTGGRQHQARRIGAGVARRRVHRRRQRGGRPDHAGCPSLPIRPPRRRQHPLQRDPARGGGQGRLPGTLARPERRGARDRGVAGWQHQRRARHRPPEAGRADALQDGYGARPDADAETYPGSAQPDEPGQGDRPRKHRRGAVRAVALIDKALA